MTHGVDRGGVAPGSGSAVGFVETDGSTPLTANWDAGSYKITAQQLESDVATGTAPLVIASTTKVDNLNADLLDGISSAGFQEQADNVFRVVGSSDATKKVAFEVDGLTTATTRTVTVPDADATLAGTNVKQTWTKQQRPLTAALTSSTTITWDLDVAQVATLSLAHNATLSAPSNGVAGTYYTLAITNTGSYTLAFNSAYLFDNGVDPTITDSGKDHLTFYYDGTDMWCVGVVQALA